MVRIVLAVVLGCITATASWIACFNAPIDNAAPGDAPGYVSKLFEGPLRTAVEDAGHEMPDDRTEFQARTLVRSGGMVYGGVTTHDSIFVSASAGRAGFPFRDSAWHYHYGFRMRDGRQEQFAIGNTPIRYKFSLPGLRADALQIPQSTLPLGLALNTCVHIAIFAGLLVGIGAARRRIRASRGRCTACGYVIDGADQCPECGLRPA